MNENEIENELKHWGILGMKWGIRNYQNPDGSLTPLGRIRYGVGPKKDITGNVMGANDAGSLSDEELRRMTKRYQQQADYYNARNNYIYQEKRFKENTAPPPKKASAVGRFIGNVFGRPIENMMQKNSEFFLTFLGYKGMEQMFGPEIASQYMSSVSGMKMEPKDPVKKATADARKMNEYYDEQEKLKEHQRKASDPNYKTNDDLADSAKQASQVTKYMKAKSDMEDLLRRKASDPNIDMDDYLDMVYNAEAVYGPYDQHHGFRY